jgi:hypothetical protein
MRSSRSCVAFRSSFSSSSKRLPGRFSIIWGATSQRPQAPAPYGALAGLLPRRPPSHFRILADKLRAICISTSLPPPSAQWPVRSRRKERLGRRHGSRSEFSSRSPGLASLPRSSPQPLWGTVALRGRTPSVRVKRVRIEADCLGSSRREHVERGVGRRGSAARLRRASLGPTRPNQLGSNEALQVERWKAVGNLLGRLPLVADELEHVPISVFHTATVLARGLLRERTSRARPSTEAGGFQRS